MQTIEFKTPLTPADEQILTPDAVNFLTALHRNFNARRLEPAAGPHRSPGALGRRRTP
ncbi:hypothetical protein [Terriglobus roseus]|uniref:hypothetical protein n=1 Tax=Terriglobus roseus TaxID=392734 RepID=UPI0002E2CA50|nr:hypothetical protein [Terriglobus roseus]